MGACCLSRFFTMYILDVKYYRIYRSERGGQGYRNGKESENSANVIGRVKRRESIFKRRDSIPRNEIYSNSARFLPFIVAERFLFAKIRRNPSMKYRKTPLKRSAQKIIFQKIIDLSSLSFSIFQKQSMELRLTAIKIKAPNPLVILRFLPSVALNCASK